MTLTKRAIVALTAAGTLSLCSCATDYQTTQAQGAAGGAAGGALLGAILGEVTGLGAETGALIGGGLGAAGGAVHGTNVAEKKQAYIKQENYLDNYLAHAKGINDRLVAQNNALLKRIENLKAEAQRAKDAADYAEIRRKAADIQRQADYNTSYNTKSQNRYNARKGFSQAQATQLKGAMSNLQSTRAQSQQISQIAQSFTSFNG